MTLPTLFDLPGKVAVITGGDGVLGGSMADALAGAGARIAVLGRRRDAAKEKARALRVGRELVGQHQAAPDGSRGRRNSVAVVLQALGARRNEQGA